MPAASSSKARRMRSRCRKTSTRAKGVERVIRYAFEYCERHKKQDGSPRQRVLMCDKSNAMTHAGGLWQRVFKEVSQGVSADHSRAYVRGRALHADGARSAAVRRNRHQQHVRRHHHRSRRRHCRAGWAWRPAEIFIPEKLRCSSRCTAPRRRLRERISPTRSARS